MKRGGQDGTERSAWRWPSIAAGLGLALLMGVLFIWPLLGYFGG